MRTRRLPRLAGLVAAAALIGAACGGTDDADSQSEPTPAEEADQAAPAASLLSFSSPLVGGGEIDAATLGDKPTAFWFWSPT